MTRCQVLSLTLTRSVSWSSPLQLFIKLEQVESTQLDWKTPLTRLPIMKSQYAVVAVLVVGVGIPDTSERDPNSRDLCSDLVNSPSFPCLHGSEPLYQEDCCKISAIPPGE